MHVSCVEKNAQQLDHFERASDVYALSLAVVSNYEPFGEHLAEHAQPLLPAPKRTQLVCHRARPVPVNVDWVLYQQCSHAVYLLLLRVEKTAQQLDHSKRSSAVHPLSLADVSAYEPVSEQFAEHPQPAPPPPGATSNSRSSPPSAPPIDKFLLANSAGATDSKKKQRSSKKHRKGKKKKESVGKKSSPKFTVEDVYLDDEDRARAPSLPVDLRYEIERKGSTRRRVPESILVKEKFPEIPFLQEIRTVNTAKPGFWKKLRGKKKCVCCVYVDFSSLRVIDS